MPKTLKELVESDTKESYTIEDLPTTTWEQFTKPYPRLPKGERRLENLSKEFVEGFAGFGAVKGIKRIPMLFHGVKNSDKTSSVLREGFTKGQSAELNIKGTSTSRDPVMSYRVFSSANIDDLLAVDVKAKANEIRNLSPSEYTTGVSGGNAYNKPNLFFNEAETFFPRNAAIEKAKNKFYNAAIELEKSKGIGQAIADTPAQIRKAEQALVKAKKELTSLQKKPKSHSIYASPREMNPTEKKYFKEGVKALERYQITKGNDVPIQYQIEKLQALKGYRATYQRELSQAIPDLIRKIENKVPNYYLPPDKYNKIGLSDIGQRYRNYTYRLQGLSTQEQIIRNKSKSIQTVKENPEWLNREYRKYYKDRDKLFNELEREFSTGGNLPISKERDKFFTREKAIQEIIDGKHRK